MAQKCRFSQAVQDAHPSHCSFVRSQQAARERLQAKWNRKKNRTEQSRTEQSRTEQNRTEQNRTEQNRTEQNRNACRLPLEREPALPSSSLLFSSLLFSSLLFSSLLFSSLLFSSLLFSSLLGSVERKIQSCLSLLSLTIDGLCVCVRVLRFHSSMHNYVHCYNIDMTMNYRGEGAKTGLGRGG